MTSVVGVIVAAGESTRMGRPKQLLPILSRPMLQWVVDAAEASKLDRVVVVTGHASEEVRAAIRLGRAIWAHNPHPEQGTMSSLRAGVAAGGPADAVMKLVSDQPEIATSVIDRLVDAWDPSQDRASLVEYRDGDGHPLLLATSVLAMIIGQDGDRLVWELIEGSPEEVRRLAVDRTRPVDVNVPDDVQLVAERLGNDPPG